MKYVLCLKNKGYKASLELRKVYPVLEDKDAEAMDLLRVVDESGEDYLYPTNFFISVELPETAKEVFVAYA